MLRSVPLPHISSPPFTFSLLRIKSHNSCSAPDLEYYAAVTKPSIDLTHDSIKDGKQSAPTHVCTVMSSGDTNDYGQWAWSIG